ncbi:hypothetical protein [Microbispora amethystogenes]|uniref:Conjugal transfer protein TraI n=1 Tax=Microbispora amethystogenes TaxID=1427754 RepID=A0ABQ4FPT8_9ACTN|nr:hypothetical protein [Microbispora amethystogenes]GIH36835.1 hypothetical protein Mam01_69990 [Microbispora amethystogenes]
MSTTTPNPNPEPSPEEVSRGLAEIEQHLMRTAPTAPVPRPLAGGQDADRLPGETRRVRALRAEVAEAHLLAGLQDDDAPLLLDTPKVRKRRKKAQEAARLHELSQQPAQLAYTAAKARRRVNIGLTVALVLALGWSTAGVQVFASEGADPWSPGWLFAWFVEPFMSIALMSFVGAKAFFGTRGQPATDRVLDRIEYLFLALTLGMNAFPHLPGVADPFRFPSLVLHILGPIVAYAVVTGWPRLLARFASLDHGLTGLTYGANADDPVRETGPDVTALVERARALISAGELPPDPSAYRLRRVLRCGMDDARAVRDALNPSTAN